MARVQIPVGASFVERSEQDRLGVVHIPSGSQLQGVLRPHRGPSETRFEIPKNHHDLPHRWYRENILSFYS